MDRMMLGPKQPHEHSMEGMRRAATNPIFRGSLRASMREQSFVWMAENPGCGRPHFLVQDQPTLYWRTRSTPWPTRTPPPAKLVQESQITHLQWVKVLTELRHDHGPDVATKHGLLCEMAAWAVVMADSGDFTEAEIHKSMCKKYKGRCASQPGGWPFKGKAGMTGMSTKQLKAAQKKEARIAKKGGETSHMAEERERKQMESYAKVLLEDMQHNITAREHNRQIEELKQQSQFVMDLRGMAIDEDNRRRRGPVRRPSPPAREEPRVVELTAEDKARSKYKSWARQLYKRDRQSRFSTALSEFNSEKHKEVRAACDAAAAAKLAKEEAELAARKPGPSVKPTVWAEGADGERARSPRPRARRRSPSRRARSTSRPSRRRRSCASRSSRSRRRRAARRSRSAVARA